MVWYIIALVAFAVAAAILVITHIRDRRYVRMKVSQAMDPAVWEELEEERKAAHARRDKWRGALEHAGEGKGGNP